MNNPLDTLRGNTGLKNYIQGEIQRNALAHAYILEGPQGSGRHTLALGAAILLAGDCPEGQKIAAGCSPDVKCFGPSREKKQLTVDVIRAMKEDALLKSNDLPFKCYLIEKADCMNIQAQNAALKILEEPPANTYFFLLCESAGMLLPTVRSRAPVLRMQRFSFEELDGLLKKEERFRKIRLENKGFYDRCLRSAGGSLGRAEELLSDTEEQKGEDPAFELLSRAGDRVELTLYLLKLNLKRPEFGETLLRMRLILRDLLLLRYRVREEELLCLSSLEEAGSLCRGFSKSELLEAFDFLTDLQEKTEKNLNIQNAKMALATGLCRISGA